MHVEVRFFCPTIKKVSKTVAYEIALGQPIVWSIRYIHLLVAIADIEGHI